MSRISHFVLLAWFIVLGAWGGRTNAQNRITFRAAVNPTTNSTVKNGGDPGFNQDLSSSHTQPLPAPATPAPTPPASPTPSGPPLHPNDKNVEKWYLQRDNLLTSAAPNMVVKGSLELQLIIPKANGGFSTSGVVHRTVQINFGGVNAEVAPEIAILTGERQGDKLHMAITAERFSATVSDSNGIKFPLVLRGGTEQIEISLADGATASAPALAMPAGITTSTKYTLSRKPKNKMLVQLNVAGFKQSNPTACWLAAGAITEAYRDGTPVDESKTLGVAGEKFSAIYAANGSPLGPDEDEFFRNLGLTIENASQFTPSGIEQILNNDDPIIARLDFPSEHVAHAVVITGIEGNGTPSGTTLTLIDPWTGGNIVMTYPDFLAGIRGPGNEFSPTFMHY